LQNTGKQIYLKAIENIFVNPKKPENHNLYIADKNRGYVKNIMMENGTLIILI
jgi:hypothetical protein